MRKFVKTLPLNVNNHQPVSLNAVCFDSESYNHQSNLYQFVSTKHESTSNIRLPSKRGFKIASLNVNSLSAHINEVRILLDDKFLDVLAIQETQLNNSHRDSEFYIPVLIQLDAIESVMAVVVFVSISNLASIFLFETILTQPISKMQVSKFKNPNPSLLLLSIGIGHQIPMLDCIHTLRTLSENQI